MLDSVGADTAVPDVVPDMAGPDTYPIPDAAPPDLWVEPGDVLLLGAVAIVGLAYLNVGLATSGTVP